MKQNLKKVLLANVFNIFLLAMKTSVCKFEKILNIFAKKSENENYKIKQ